MKPSSKETFYFYDLETFGTDSRADRIAQFAGVRTDLQLKPIEAPMVLYCKITPDFLPDPQSCLITGIAPQETQKKGIPENAFIAKINAAFSQPGSCVVGYNNIHFDDEFIRNALYRNLMDPYEREYSSGNSRWDLLPVVRMTHDLRPEGIVWPTDEEGFPCFRLEKLTEANGIAHANAHDAMADVWATVALAQLIQNRQPKLFRYLYQNRTKQAVMPFMDFTDKQALLYTHSLFRSREGSTTLIAPLAYDCSNRNKIYCCDLMREVQPLIDLPVEELRRLFFASYESKQEKLAAINLFPIEINKAPALSVVRSLRLQDAERLHLDPELALSRLETIRRNEGLTVKLFQIFLDLKQYPYPPAYSDPDLMLYSGSFFNDHDKNLMKAVHDTEPSAILETNYRFDDARLPEMVWRYVCRNYPEVLSEKERLRWHSFCAARLCMPAGGRINDINFYFRKIEEKVRDKDLSPKGKAVLPALLDYGRQLQEEILGMSSETACEKPKTDVN